MTEPPTGPSTSPNNAHVDQDAPASGKAALRLASRSVSMWLLLVLTIGALAALVFMAFHLHPMPSGKVRGPGDEAAPNAPADYRRR